MNLSPRVDLHPALNMRVEIEKTFSHPYAVLRRCLLNALKLNILTLMRSQRFWTIWGCKVRVPAWTGSRLQTATFLLCPYMVGGARGLSLFFIMRTPFLWPKHIPKAPPPNIITLALGFQHRNLQGTWTFRPKQQSAREKESAEVGDGISISLRNHSCNGCKLFRLNFQTSQ